MKNSIVNRLRADISPLRDLKSTERNKLHLDAAAEIEFSHDQLRRFVMSYDKHNPVRQADFHSITCDCLRCLRDQIDSTLGKVNE